MTLFLRFIILKLGGSLKKYNKANSNWVFLGLVLPILLFFVGLNFVYAYFTASANPASSNGVTGIIRVGFTNNTTTKEINSASIGDTTKLVPGDVLTISGAVENKGTAPIYAVLNFEIKITKANNETETISRFYTMKDTTLTTLTSNESNLLPISSSGVENEYLQTAFYLNEPTQEEGEDPVYDFSPFKLTYIFDGDTYNNSYQDALVEYRATAYAIQTVNLTEDETKAPMVATHLLLQDKNYKSYVVMGNSIQSATPTITTPVEVQSFGDKTKNLLDYKRFITSGKIKEIENGIQFEKTGGRIDIKINFTFKANTTYVISAECTRDGYLGGKFNNNFSGFIWCDKNAKSIVVKNLTDADVTESIHCVDTTGTKGSTIKFAMLEINSSATEYEPYGYKVPVKVNDTTTNIYLNEPLRKVGDVADYIDFATGTVVRRVKVGTISSDTSFAKFANVTNYSAFYINKTDLIDVQTYSVYSFAVLSDKFTGTSASGANTNKNWSAAYQISASISPTYKRICFTLPADIDVSSAKEWLAENIITYYYPTNEPIVQTIDLPDLGDFNEGTIFTFNTEIQPSDIAIDV